MQASIIIYEALVVVKSFLPYDAKENIMEKFDLSDFQRKIDELLKQKGELDKQIEGLKIAEAVFKQEKNPATIINVMAPKYSGMTIWEVGNCIINENNGISCKEIISLAKKDGANYTENSFRTVLSKRCKQGYIKKLKKKGVNLYFPVRNRK